MTLEAALPDDADAASALIAETDPPLFRHLGGGDIAFALVLIGALWRREGTILSHDIARVAREARRVVGLLIAMPGRVRGAMLAATNAAAAALVPPDRAAAIFAAWTAVDWLAPAIPEDAFFVQNLAVAAPTRRHGLGARILETACAIARHRGLASVHLDVAADNQAIAFYERCGFVKTVETRVPALAPARHRAPLAHGARPMKMRRDRTAFVGADLVSARAAVGRGSCRRHHRRPTAGWADTRSAPTRRRS
jgi:ribosomal protein S18 acetylase RimI-like enzyme